VLLCAGAIAALALTAAARPDDRPERVPEHVTKGLNPSNSALSTALRSASADELAIHEHVVTLANPYFEGRGVGTRGGKRASEYIAFYLQRAGVLPLFEPTNDAHEPGYFQMVRIDGDPQSATATVRIKSAIGDIPDRVLQQEKDFSVVGFSGSGRAHGALAFVGYSIARGPNSYRSYNRKDDLTGRIAVMLRYEPFNSRGRSTWSDGAGRWSRRAALLKKVREAVRRGAAGVVIVNPPGTSDPGSETMVDFEATVLGAQMRVPVVAIDAIIVDSILRASDLQGRSLAQLTAWSNRDGRHGAVMLDERQTITLDVNVTSEVIRSANVGGIVRGRGSLADDSIIIGAHYDHLGYGMHGGLRKRTQGQIHPGADDNASGVAGLLVLADHLAKVYAEVKNQQPMRSIVFVAFTGEEMGLLGSQWFVAHGLNGLGSPAVMLNMDMIGRLRDRRLTVEGVDTAEGFREFLKPIFSASPLRIRMKGDGIGRSDHTSFHQAGLPVLQFFTGTHDQYHTPRDTSNLVNFAGAAQVVEVVENVVLALATRETLPAFHWTGDGRFSAARLGVIIADSRASGVRIEAVDSGGAAAAAGLEAGDRIVRWEGVVMKSTKALEDALAERAPGDEVVVVVERNGSERLVKVRLHGRLESFTEVGR